MFKKKILIENPTNIFMHDKRRRRKRSSAFGAGMKCFERDFKGKLFQKFSLNSYSHSFFFFFYPFSPNARRWRGALSRVVQRVAEKRVCGHRDRFAIVLFKNIEILHGNFSVHIEVGSGVIQSVARNRAEPIFKRLKISHMHRWAASGIADLAAAAGISGRD